MYSERARRLIAKMPNRGSLPDATHTAEAEHPVCGDLIRLYLSIENGKVRDASFECDGCPGAVASAAGLTELVKGKTETQCRTIDIEDLKAYVGELPSHKRHGLELACEVLRRSLGL